MTVLSTRLDPGGAEYTAFREAMLAKLAELDGEHAKALAGGGPSTSNATASAASCSPASGSSC